MTRVLLYQKENSNGNPYLYEVERILHAHGIETERASLSFWDMKGTYDVINLQWPEELFNWKEPSDNDLAKLERTLVYWKSNSKIVVTRHNIIPHNKKDNPQYVKLYNLVLGKTDGIIHMGEYSKHEYLERYKNSPTLLNKIHGIVPHPIYTEYENTISKTQARQELGIPKNKIVILVFGSIRNFQEKKFIKKVFSKLQNKNKYLLTSYYPLDQFKGSRYLNPLRRLWLNLKPNQKKFYEKVPFDKVQYFLNAADILFIQRKENLNSGLVFLGFAFSKTIVGPGVANIKAILEKTKNFTFDPCEPETAIQALDNACDHLQGQETIKKNIQENYISEDEIAKNYIQFFHDVMKNTQSQITKTKTSPGIESKEIIQQ